MSHITGEIQPQKRPATRPQLVRARLARVTEGALGTLLASPPARILPPHVLGCLVVLCQDVAARDGFLECGSRSTVECGLAALAVRGVTLEVAEMALRSLHASGLVEVAAERFSIPALDRVREAEQREATNRAAGYKKRAAATGAAVANPTAHARRPAEPAICAAPALPTTNVLAPAADTSTALPANATKPQVRRFGPDDSRHPALDDPTVVRLKCEGERCAEVTHGYLQHLMQTYPSIDVLQQLKQAALWLESNPARRKTFGGLRRFLNQWLSRATDAAAVRSQVVKATSQRNGFGQGGAYDDSGAGSADDLCELDDFSARPRAVEPLLASTASEAPATSHAAHPAGLPGRPNPVLIARANRANRLRGAAAPAQRRLSDQLSPV